MIALPEGWKLLLDEGYVVILAPDGRFVELEIAPTGGGLSDEYRAELQAARAVYRAAARP